MKKVSKLFLVLLVSMLVLVGCGGSGGSDNKLVVYTPNSEGILNSVIPLFEEKTGHDHLNDNKFLIYSHK